MANVMLGGRQLPLRPGDSAERMERVAGHAQLTLDEARARLALRGGDADDAALMALLDMCDRLMMAQDENTRLRRDMLGLRGRQFELESRADALARENAGLRAELEALTADADDANDE